MTSINNSNKRFFQKLLTQIIILYQRFISPLLPARCRYYPTCSDYGKQAIAWHGTWVGAQLLLKRLSRCHPLGGHGIDFVPLPLASYHYQYLNKACFFSGRYSSDRGVYRDQSSYAARLNQLMRIT